MAILRFDGKNKVFGKTLEIRRKNKLKLHLQFHVKISEKSVKIRTSISRKNVKKILEKSVKITTSISQKISKKNPSK